MEETETKMTHTGREVQHTDGMKDTPLFCKLNGRLEDFLHRQFTPLVNSILPSSDGTWGSRKVSGEREIVGQRRVLKIKKNGTDDKVEMKARLDRRVG